MADTYVIEVGEAGDPVTIEVTDSVPQVGPVSYIDLVCADDSETYRVTVRLSNGIPVLRLTQQ